MLNVYFWNKNEKMFQIDFDRDLQHMKIPGTLKTQIHIDNL